MNNHALWCVLISKLLSIKRCHREANFVLSGYKIYITSDNRQKIDLNLFHSWLVKPYYDVCSRKYPWISEYLRSYYICWIWLSYGKTIQIHMNLPINQMSQTGSDLFWTERVLACYMIYTIWFIFNESNIMIHNFPLNNPPSDFFRKSSQQGDRWSNAWQTFIPFTKNHSRTFIKFDHNGGWIVKKNSYVFKRKIPFPDPFFHNSQNQHIQYRTLKRKPFPNQRFLPSVENSSVFQRFNQYSKRYLEALHRQYLVETA